VEDRTPGTLGLRLARLVDAVPDVNGARYTARGIATAVNERAGPGSMSHTYVANLLSGRSSNPTLRSLELLADLFGVPVAYFFDDAMASRVDQELEALVALRAAGVRHLAARMAGLSEGSLSGLAQIIEQIRALEGLDPGRDPRPPRQ
jgi:transcriptional regulator with XRE-family HTH domain